MRWDGRRAGGPSPDPDPDVEVLALGGLVVGVVLILVGWLATAPGPEDVARRDVELGTAVALPPAVEMLDRPGSVPPVSFWAYEHVRSQRDSLRSRLRCLRQYDGEGWLDDVEAALASCGVRP